MSDRYEIRGKLGRGGIGAVYTGYDTQLDREVAIKRLLPLEETQLNEADSGSLTREAAALAKFQHPNVVTIFGFEEDEDGPFVVTELIKGENLKVIIEKGALSVRDFQEFVSQALDAMIAAEQLNLLHRDIKPANLMLLFLPSGKFQVKILDFGLAKFSQTPSTQTLDHKGSFLGSIDYIAPEQIERRPLDQRTDLYSLGCVCYFALTQKPPFEGKNLAETMNNHLNHKVIPITDIRPDLPPAIGAWVMRLIAMNPSHRPDNATEAVLEFEQSKIGIAPELPGGDGSSSPISGSAPVAVTPAPSSMPATSSQPTMPAKETGSQALTKDGRKILTQPMAELPSRTSSIDLGTTRSKPTRPQNAAQAKSEKKMGGPIAILAIAVVLGIGALIYVFGFKDNSVDDNPAPVEPEIVDTVEEPKTDITPPGNVTEITLPNPSKIAPKRPDQKMIDEHKLPIKLDELAGHFVASEMTYQLDQETKAEPGDRVGSWGNFTWKEGEPARFLARNYGDKTGQHCPRLVFVGPSQFPEFNGPHSLIRFEEQSTIGIPLNVGFTDQLAGTKLTCIIVCEISAGQGPIIRLQSQALGQAVSILPKEGQIQVGVKAGEESTNVKVPFDKRKEFGIMTYTRDGNSQEITVIDSKGKRYNSGKQPCVDDAFTLEVLSLGVSPFNRWGTAFLSAHVAELAVFGRALSPEERTATEQHLLTKYFRKSSGRKPAPKGSEKQTSIAPIISDPPKGLKIPENPTVNNHGIPLPPAAASGLVGHYSAQNWLFGKGFKAPAKVGDAVYSMGNLTPGAGKYHLLGSIEPKYGAPKLIAINPSEAPELKDGTRVLRFTTNDSLVTPKVKDAVTGLEGDKLTVVALTRPQEREKNRVLKFDALTESEPEKPARGVFNMITHPEVFGTSMRVGDKWPGSNGRRKAGEFFILTSTWNGKTGNVASVIRDSKGGRIKGNVQANGRKEKLNVIRYALGRDSINEYDSGYAGDVVEVLIFKELLTEDQIIQNENWLAERFFK